MTFPLLRLSVRRKENIRERANRSLLVFGWLYKGKVYLVLFLLFFYFYSEKTSIKKEEESNEQKLGTKKERGVCYPHLKISNSERRKERERAVHPFSCSKAVIINSLCLLESFYALSIQKKGKGVKR